MTIELNMVYNEDCLEGMKLIPDESVDLVVTDPPYLVNYKTGYRKDKGHKFASVIANDDSPDVVSEYIKECYRIMKPNTAMYIFCSSDKVDFFKTQLEKYFKIKNMIIWVKNNHTAGDLTGAFGRKYEIIFLVNKGRKVFNGKRVTDVWEFDKVGSHSLVHQNQKPVALIEQAIYKHSAPGDVVFDGFMGSGTTAIACLNTGRNYLGFELDPEYFEVAQNRIAEHKTELETKENEETI